MDRCHETANPCASVVRRESAETERAFEPVMKKALLAVILSIAAPLLADGRTYTIPEGGKTYAPFESHAPRETTQGTTTKVPATITADAANASASAATITVDLNALDTGISM